MAQSCWSTWGASRYGWPPEAVPPNPRPHIRLHTVYYELPETRRLVQYNRKLEITWEDYWNALLNKLLPQSTLLIKINEADNNVIQMFVHKGSLLLLVEIP